MNYYDEIAEGYDALHGEEQRKKTIVIQKVLEELGIGFDSLLDIGCGSGISLEGWDCEKKGIDPSVKLVEKAKQKGFDVQVGSAEEIPFGDHSFDLVICLTAAHHFDLHKALKEMKRVGRQYFVFSFLKKADVEGFRKKLIEEFRVIKEIAEEKDIIFICQC